MIRLRRMFERGRAHRVLGPLLLVVFVLLLAMVFLHIAHEGWHAATEFGAICMSIATALGLVLLERARGHFSERRVSSRGDRAPPSPRPAQSVRPFAYASSPHSLPLRR